MQLAIISSRDDAHIPFVTRHLPTGFKWVIVDPLKGTGTSGLSFEFVHGKLHFLYGGRRIDGITSVWYRKPTIFNFDDLHVERTYEKYTETALKNHVDVVRYCWPEAFWMSDISAIYRASQKPLQQEAAYTLGFNVPDTLTTGDKMLAREFVKKHKRCVVKTQGIEFPFRKVLMTKIISSDQHLAYDGLSVDPMIFQQYIEPAYELRVTVAGDNVFAARVGGKDIDGIPFRDWRYAHINNTFYAEKATLDPETVKACVALTKRFNLAFGAIDLIVDKQQKVWFLEINPNGQWAFIEEQTKQPIGRTIADMLVTGKH